MSDAITLFIVDDEPPVIEGLRTVVERDLASFSVCGWALNGREALDGVRKHQPDVLLLDIHMPGADGIEVLRTLRERGESCYTILVTAYERFDVASRAFGLGVREYLLKPVSPRRLAECLHHAQASIIEARRREQQLLEAAETSQSALGLAEQLLVQQVEHGREDVTAINELTEHLGSRVERCLPALVHVEADDPVVADVRREVRSRSEFSLRALFGREQAGRFAVLVPSSMRSREELLEQFRTIVREVASHRGVHASVQCGSEVALRDAGREFATMDGRRIAPSPELAALRSRLASESELGQRGAHDTFEAYVRVAAEGHALRPALLALIAALGGRAPAAGGDLDPVTASLADALGAQDERDLVALARRLVAGRIDGADSGRSFSPLVQRAVEMVRQDPAGKVSLEWMAERLSVSPGHLSRMFSGETGKTFVEFLSESRVDHACRLIRETSLTIKEVAFESGYNDPNYFSRAFKRLRGVTPTEYARAARSEA
ncbi:MAG: helix-turn-helix domain-containing protein [Spirochaetales bacterium]